MRSFAIAIIAFVLGLGSGGGVHAGESPAELLQRIDAAKREHLNHYLRDVTLITLATSYADGMPVNTTKYRFIAGKDRFLYRVLEKRDLARNEALPVPEDFWVGHSGWLFRITQKESGEHLISAALPWNDENFFSICRGESGVTIPVAAFEVTIADYLRLPDLTVRSSSEVNWHGKNLTRVSVVRSLKGGWDEDFYFDTARGWLYQGSERRGMKTGVRVSSRVYYQPDNVTPQKWEYQVTPANGAPKTHYLAEVLEFRKESHSDREFSLTQFGLPDPVSPPKPTPMYLWLILAAIGFVGLAIGMRALAKRWK